MTCIVQRIAHKFPCIGKLTFLYGNLFYLYNIFYIIFIILKAHFNACSPLRKNIHTQLELCLQCHWWYVASNNLSFVSFPNIPWLLNAPKSKKKVKQVARIWKPTPEDHAEVIYAPKNPLLECQNSMELHFAESKRVVAILIQHEIFSCKMWRYFSALKFPSTQNELII